MQEQGCTAFCLPQDLSDIQWRVFREGIPAATATMLLFIVLKTTVWLLDMAFTPEGGKKRHTLQHVSNDS